MSSPKVNVGIEDAARLLDIVPFLISHQGISLNDLAKQFSVTPDEITSDLTSLWMCGLPGYTAYELIDLSFDSGFVTISNAHTLQRPRNLQRNEALALLLGLETLLEEIDSKNPDLQDSITQLISRISLIVDQSAAQRVKAGTPSASAIRATIVDALESRDLLSITYHSSAHDEVAERKVKPLEFSLANGTEYLEAFCYRSSGYRTFRIDRIITAQKEDSSLKTIKEFTLDDESTPSTFSLKVSARRRDVFERFGVSHTATGTPNEIEAESFSPEWTIREIMSLGGAVTVSSPKPLRSAVRERALRALEGYIQ
jgi:proteasome accessory factor C